MYSYSPNSKGIRLVNTYKSDKEMKLNKRYSQLSHPKCACFRDVTLFYSFKLLKKDRIQLSAKKDPLRS